MIPVSLLTEKLYSKPPPSPRPPPPNQRSFLKPYPRLFSTHHNVFLINSTEIVFTLVLLECASKMPLPSSLPSAISWNFRFLGGRRQILIGPEFGECPLKLLFRFWRNMPNCRARAFEIWRAWNARRSSGRDSLFSFP